MQISGLHSFLQNCCDKLSKTETSQAVLRTWESYRSRLLQLDVSVTEKERQDDGLSEEPDEEPIVLQSEYALIAASSTRDTKRSLKAVEDGTKASLSERQRLYTILIDEIHKTCTELFDKHLISHEHLPLHELFWYNFEKPHMAVFNPCTRLSIRESLLNYEMYLGEGRREPETAALFKLFNDSGQLINLYDWYQAFRQVYSRSSADDSKAEEMDDHEEQLLQALFMRSAMELKFMGFFKSTKRKTDHVQKTVTII